MADTKITALTALTAADPANDVIPIVDVSDTSMAASGTTKKISVNNILGASGTATLASATITGAATVGTTLGVTGDLTVDTNTLFVDSTNNCVGILTATPDADRLANTGLVIGNGTTSRGIMFYGTSSSQQNLAFSDTAAAQQGLLQYDHSVDQMKFFTSGALQATLTTTALTIATGNVVMATSGKGIDFSATTSGSGTMTSELLNDYEEGTWVGTLTGSTTNPTVAVTATGRYTKIGRVVTVQIFYSNVSTVGASGNISITGLPFANSTLQSVGAVSLYQIGTFTGSTFAIIDSSNSSIEFNSNISGSVYGNVTHNAGIARYLTTSITYTVA